MDEFEIDFMHKNKPHYLTSRQETNSQSMCTRHLSELCQRQDENSKFVNKWIQEKAFTLTCCIESAVIGVMSLNGKRKRYTIGQWTDMALNVVSYQCDFDEDHSPNLLEDLDETYPMEGSEQEG